VAERTGSILVTGDVRFAKTPNLSSVCEFDDQGAVVGD
jgi:hypothetical protein